MRSRVLNDYRYTGDHVCLPLAQRLSSRYTASRDLVAWLVMQSITGMRLIYSFYHCS